MEKTFSTINSRRRIFNEFIRREVVHLCPLNFFSSVSTPCSEDAKAGGSRSHMGKEIVVGFRYAQDTPVLP